MALSSTDSGVVQCASAHGAKIQNSEKQNEEHLDVSRQKKDRQNGIQNRENVDEKFAADEMHNREDVDEKHGAELTLRRQRRQHM